MNLLLVSFFGLRRDNGGCTDAILPVRTIQQIEAFCTSSVAVLKSYLASGVRVCPPEIVALMSQVKIQWHAMDCKNIYPMYVSVCHHIYP